MTSMANSSKSPQAGAACGRATWPFREKIREIFNAPLRMNSAWKTTTLVERIGGEEFSMGALPVILVGVRHSRINDKKDDRPCSFFFMPKTFRFQMQKHVSTVWCAEFCGSTVEDFLSVYTYLTARIVSSEIFSAMVVVECSSGMPSGTCISSSPVQYVQRWIGEKMMEGSPWSWATTT